MLFAHSNMNDEFYYDIFIHVCNMLSTITLLMLHPMAPFLSSSPLSTLGPMCVTDGQTHTLLHRQQKICRIYPSLAYFVKHLHTFLCMVFLCLGIFFTYHPLTDI